MTDPVPTPPASTVWPPAPLGDEQAPLSFQVDGIELTQSGGRLSVVNHFVRRVFIVQMCVFSLSLLSPFYSYWTSPFHHATWRAMLPAVMATYRQTYWVELLVLFVAVLFYWSLVVVGNLGGVALDQRTSTAKAGGRMRPLSELDSVEIVRRQPDIFRRCYTVQLQWSDGPVLLWWQKALLSLGPKTSFAGVFRQEADAENLARAIAEFANAPLQHRTR